MSRPTVIATLVLGACIALLPGIASANIVVNGGFETGDFTGWMTNPAPSGSFPWVIQTFGGLGPGVPNSGNYYASNGCVGSTCTDPGLTDGNWLTQTLTTVPGVSYDLSFAYDPSAGGPAELQAVWNGVVVFDQMDNQISDPGYTPETVPDLLATSTSTTLTFLGRQDPGFDGLDDISVDVSVSATPEPSTLALFGTVLPGLTGIAVLRRRRRSTTAAR